MSATAKLNPAAPTFKAVFGRGKDREKTEHPRSNRKHRKDTSESADEYLDDYPPSASHVSRDTHSIHTQDSITESYDSLERATSNTAMSDGLAAYSTLSGRSSEVRDGKENSFQKLLRKGSSSKFSISSFRAKESGLFGSKKGAASERNASGDRSSSFGEGEGEEAGRSMENVGVTSSPMPLQGEGKGAEGKGAGPWEGRMSVNWGRFSIKKKGRVSEEIERASETEGTEDEGIQGR